MRRQNWYPIAIVAGVALVLIGGAYFTLSGSKDDQQVLGQTSQKDIMTQQNDPITLSGRINATGQLVDDLGRTFELANSDESLEVRAMMGRKVRITGTVMEEGAKQIVEVQDYTIVE